MTALRTLLAGWDTVAGRNHQQEVVLPALNRHDMFTPVGVVGADPASAAAASAAGLPLLDDLAEAVASTGADLVSVCHAGPGRRDLIAAALDAGAHVLVDRPPAETADAARAIADRANRLGLVCLPALPYRLHPRIRSVRAAIAGGRVGLPWNVQADLLVTGAGPLAAGEWASVATLSIDVVRHLVRLPVLGVYAMTHASLAGPHDEGEAGRPSAEDVAVIALEHTHGLRSTLTVCWRPEDGPPVARVHRYRVSGSHGVVEIDLAAPALTIAGRCGALADPTRPDLALGLLDEVHRAISGTPCELTNADGVASAEIVEAMRAALAAGAPVAIPDQKSEEPR